MVLCLVIALVDFIGVHGWVSCFGYDEMHSYSFLLLLWLDDRVTLLSIQLHDMHVDLTILDVVLVMYMPMN